jgi:TonB family protein
MWLVLRRALILSLALPLARAGAAMGLPAPPYPYVALAKHEEGTVMVKVIFGNDGRVTSCRVLQSSGVPLLDDCTVNYIKEHWIDRSCAGQTLRLPITYSLGDHAPSFPDSLGEINHLPPGSPPRTVVLRVHFDTDGSVEKVELSKGSGIDQLDKDTVAFAWLHLRSVPYAGKSELVPIIFRPAAGAKSAVNQGQAGG